MDFLIANLDLIMVIATCCLLLLGYPVAFSLAGVALVFAFLAWEFGVFDLSFLRAFPQRIFGTMTNEVLLAVPLFIFMGVMLERSQVAENLLDSMGKLFGTLRGGLGISVFLVGALLAASTGIVGATVVTMGLLSLPVMLKRGYDPALASGVIAASGTLGQIIPPSIVLILLGDVISNAYQQAQLSQGIFSPEAISVGDLFAGALLPGLMLVGFYIAYQIWRAIINPASSPSIPSDPDVQTRVFLWQTLKALIAPVVLIIAVLGSILTGIATPTEAAGVGAIGSLLLAGSRHKIALRPVLLAGVSLMLLFALAATTDMRIGREEIPATDMLAIIAAGILLLFIAAGCLYSLYITYRTGILAEVCRSTAETSSMVFALLIGAALFSLVFRGLGGDDTIHALLNDIPGGTMGAIISVMVIMFLLGFFLDFIEITFVVVPLVAPVLLTMGIDPVWLGVMMAINLQTSFLTPPFGFALFYLRGVAPPEIKTAQIYRGAIPFVGLQLLALIVLSFFPSIATWLPEVMFP
ncbi:MAG: TRAP transporter large permease subunit [Parvularculales bacterium]